MKKNLNICANEDEETVFLLHKIKNCSLGTLALQTRNGLQDSAPCGTFMCSGRVNIIVHAIKTGDSGRSSWESLPGAHSCENQKDPVFPSRREGPTSKDVL